jgi:hypothetical protein
MNDFLDIPLFFFNFPVEIKLKTMPRGNDLGQLAIADGIADLFISPGPGNMKP